MDITKHPICKAIHHIRSLSLLLDTNPLIAKQDGIEFSGEHHNVVPIDNLLSLLKNRYETEISITELEAMMPTLCRLFQLEYDGLFITLL